MDDFAGIFIILIFLFYAVIAGAFIVSAMRKWVWPFLRNRLPKGRPVEQQRRSHRTDQEQHASQP